MRFSDVVRTRGQEDCRDVPRDKVACPAPAGPVPVSLDLTMWAVGTPIRSSRRSAALVMSQLL
jgi:hypothetical protein